MKKTMKNHIIAALLAAFFMLPMFGLTAYAAPEDMTGDISDVEIISDDTYEAEITVELENEALAEIMGEINLDDLSGLTESAAPIMETIETPEIPALPPGTASVIDYNTDPDGRLFYTITTPDEYVFYLVIDKNSSTDNVYFLNAVTIDDLIPLAQNPVPQNNGGTGVIAPNTPGEPEQPTTEPAPSANEKTKSGDNTGMYIIIGLFAVAGGGAGWYFKVYRPKQQGADDINEYDPSMDDGENDYSDDWGENISLLAEDENNNINDGESYDNSGESENDDFDDTPSLDEESGDEDNE